MFTTCSRHVYDIFTTCSRNVHHMFTTCSQHVYDMFTTCSRHVHGMSMTCSQHVHKMFTTCLPNVHNMFMTCSFCSFVCSSVWTPLVFNTWQKFILFIMTNSIIHNDSLPFLGNQPLPSCIEIKRSCILYMYRVTNSWDLSRTIQALFNTFKNNVLKFL